MTTVPSAPLSRANAAARGLVPATPPPERIVHLGLGAFHRAHQAWYTAKSADAEAWGIAAFTGRSPAMAERLAPQDGLYTLVTRGPRGDDFELVGSIARAAAGSDLATFVRSIAAPATAIVTLTITEAGYRLDESGEPDLSDPAVRDDLAALATALAPGASLGAASPRTALGRLLLGLEARRRAGSPPLAIVSCDNLPDNGGRLGRALLSLAESVSAPLARWLPDAVSSVSTSVDRITPSSDPSLSALVESETGWADAAPVVTEPFSSWVLSGEFPSGRPAWETAGATFVDVIEPYEARKLWLLNGAHTLLASMGRLRGHRTVAEATADPACARAVQRWWDEARRHLPAQVEADRYLHELAERFRNERIEHRLEQIATDGLTKLRLRVVPVARLERAAGRPATAGAEVIAAWIAAVRSLAPVPDSCDHEIERARSDAEPTDALLALVSPALAADAAFARTVADHVTRGTA